MLDNALCNDVSFFSSKWLKCTKSSMIESQIYLSPQPLWYSLFQQSRSSHFAQLAFSRFHSSCTLLPRIPLFLAAKVLCIFKDPVHIPPPPWALPRFSILDCHQFPPFLFQFHITCILHNNSYLNLIFCRLTSGRLTYIINWSYTCGEQAPAMSYSTLFTFYI